MIQGLNHFDIVDLKDNKFCYIQQDAKRNFAYLQLTTINQKFKKNCNCFKSKLKKPSR